MSSALPAYQHASIWCCRSHGHWQDDANFWAELEPHLLRQATQNGAVTLTLPRSNDLRKNGFAALAQAITKRGGMEKVAIAFNLHRDPVYRTSRWAASTQWQSTACTAWQVCYV